MNHSNKKLNLPNYPPLEKKTQLMGILNCTPDSFFDGGTFFEKKKAIAHGLRLFDEGADLVDVGGESTRPGSTFVSEAEEIARVVPVIEALHPRPLSIDTYKPKVAAAALDAGATFINDITGFRNPEMRQLAAASGATICVMHMKGAPHTSPTPTYPEGVIVEICRFFETQIAQLLKDGVLPSQIVLDPGIGGGSFGKTAEQCLDILKNLSVFQQLGFPLLIGLSRKSFMQRILKKEVSELLSTTLALNTMSALEGVAFIRVHDVSPHRDMLTLIEKMR